MKLNRLETLKKILQFFWVEPSHLLGTFKNCDKNFIKKKIRRCLRNIILLHKETGKRRRWEGMGWEIR